MSNLNYKDSYRRHLPHFQVADTPVFITFRLANSIPESVLVEFEQENTLKINQVKQIQNERLRFAERDFEERRYFARIDQYLHNMSGGINYLQNPEIAALISDHLHKLDQTWYDLLAYCIMPNHVHLVLTPMTKLAGNPYSISQIMHQIKGPSARESNRMLNLTGAFWQHESYDRVIRNEGELARIIDYVIENPVKAKLCAQWQDWPWSFSRFHDKQS